MKVRKTFYLTLFVICFTGFAGPDVANSKTGEGKFEAGLAGIRFNSGDFTRIGDTDVLLSIDHDWDKDRGNDWSARWYGFIEGPFSGEVTFLAKATDGLRLRIADKVVIDGLDENGPRTGKMEMNKGRKVPVVLEFTSARGKAKLHLYWQWQGRPQTIVPSEALSYKLSLLPEQVRKEFEYELGLIQMGPADFANHPLRYVGEESVQLESTDGRLRPAVGAENYQVLRANRSRPRLADGHGWTYNHGTNIAYWKGKFYVHWLSNPFGEHGPPGQTLVATSSDGINWSFPAVVFPPLHGKVPGAGDIVMHQRMGFYVAPNGRLLVLGFHGITTGSGMPNSGNGFGRVVREVYADGTYGLIYFIRYNRHNGWNESNTPYPHYTSSAEQGFKDSCRALLGNKLMTQQWWEEDRSTDGFYALAGVEDAESKLHTFTGKALSFYHRADGAAVGVWKGAWAALSYDEGKSWTDPVQCTSVCRLRRGYGSKLCGQQTDDGRYALVYDPDPSGKKRWPLAVITSDDGFTFNNMACVHGEVPPQRFRGGAKDVGPQYVRGIAEGNGNPPGDNFWVTYSMNKEDIWVSRVPVPVRLKVYKRVNDNFDKMSTGGIVTDWNIYRPKWAPVSVVEFPSTANKSLELQDKDLYDYARAVRVFPESTKATIEFKVLAKQTNTGRLEIELLSAKSKRPVRIVLADDGWIKAVDGTRTVKVIKYSKNTWLSFAIQVDALAGKFSLVINGKNILDNAAFAEQAASVERLSFRTGRFRAPSRNARTDKPNADDPVKPAVFNIDDVITR